MPYLAVSPHGRRVLSAHGGIAASVGVLTGPTLRGEVPAARGAWCGNLSAFHGPADLLVFCRPCWKRRGNGMPMESGLLGGVVPVTGGWYFLALFRPAASPHGSGEARAILSKPACPGVM